MGHCYEFASEIVPGCDHAMTVSDEGGVCECPTCGARCRGRFDRCAQVLAKPGYVPANAPQWAVDRTFTRPSGTTPTRPAPEPGESVIDLVALRDGTRDALDAAIGDAARDLRTALEGATSGVVARVRSELDVHVADRDGVAVEHLVSTIRADLTSATQQQLAAVDRLIEAIDRMARHADTDRATLRSVVEGLDRLAQRVGEAVLTVDRLEGAGSSPQDPASGRRRAAVRALVLLAAIGGALAGAHPTGLEAADIVFTAIVAGAFTAFASRAKRWTSAAASGIALVASSQSTVLFIVAALVFSAAVAASVMSDRNRIIGAILGAATIQILLRLPEWGPFGLQSLFAAIAIAIVVVSGYRNCKRSTRRTVVRAGLAVAGLFLFATFLFGVAALRARGDLDAGVDAAKLGVDAARLGDTAAAASDFDRARELLSSASDHLDSPWARAAGVVPVLAQHEDALRSMARNATRLASTGARAAREADVETLRVRDGKLDLAKVEAMRAPLDRVDRALNTTQRNLADIDSDWLLPPVNDPLDRLHEKVDRAVGSARTATLGIDAAPALLGGDRPARYLLMFTTPSEARSSGFMGNWGILTVDDGKLDLTQFGRNEKLNASGDPSTRTLSGPADYLARYGPYQPEKDWRSVTMSPDFPTVAKVASALAPQSGIGPIDGVIAIDPEGVAALLQLTGPVMVPGRSEPLTADNAAEFLLRGQYEQLSNPDRLDFLEEAARAVTDKLTHGSLPGPRALGKALGPAVKQGHILLQANDPTAERLFDRLGANGSLAPSTGDYVGLTTQNWGGSKIDIFFERSLRYAVRVDPSTGEERATATIALQNNAPTTGEPDYVIDNTSPVAAKGDNRSIVSFYSYLALTSATVEGQPVELLAQTERGMNVYTTTLTIPSGATATLRLELRGRARLVTTGGDPAVRLTVGHQVMPNPDHVEVRITSQGGWSLDPVHPLSAKSAKRATWGGQFEQRTVLEASLVE